MCSLGDALNFSFNFNSFKLKFKKKNTAFHDWKTVSVSRTSKVCRSTFQP
jgi:hypothetical protein